MPKNPENRGNKAFGIFSKEIVPSTALITNRDMKYAFLFDDKNIRRINPTIATGTNCFITA